MNGYDQFLCGAYWFFRSLFVVSLLWIILFSILNSLSLLKNKHVICGCIIGVIAFSLALQHCFFGLRISGVAQGGYRELMGLVFFAFGFICRQMLYRCQETENESISSDNGGRNTIISAVCMLNRHRYICALVAFMAIALIVCYHPVAMVVRTEKIHNVLLLALSGLLSFVVIGGMSCFIANRCKGLIKRVIFYIGQNTIYIFGFHLLAFKFVSMIKVLYYNLEWEQIGEHPVVFYQNGKWWILYTVFGVTLPLLARYIVQRYKAK